MIYTLPGPLEALDQADIIERVPLLEIQDFDLQHLESPTIGCSLNRVVVLTQTCDLQQQKTNRAVVAQALDAADLVRQSIVKATDVRGPIRTGRVWGVYFLPSSTEHNLPEMIVDLRHVQSVPIGLLQSLCATGHRKARLRSPYREHLAKHFADTYSRIGLPMPYETD